MNTEYEIRVASEEDIKNHYNQRMANEPDNPYLERNKEKCLKSFRDKTRMYFYGYIGNRVISEASATVSPKDVYTQNIDKIMDEKCAYLFNFLTAEEFRGKGYFSNLFAFLKDTLREMGFEYLSLGVEPEDEENRQRYQKMGFDELIYKGFEAFDGMEIDVEYYRKKL